MKKNTYLALMAAIAGLPLLAASTASAQYRVGSDGHALDANNRAGSGGLNQPGNSGIDTQVNGNQIVTRNVTGGAAFRGFVPYTDPLAFRATPRSERHFDQFIANSSAPNQNFSQDVMPYYGPSRAAPPPPGYVPAGPSGGYIPAPPTTRAPEDSRLDASINDMAVTLPRPGELVMAGPVDPTSRATYITASPLSGVQQWQLGDANGNVLLNNGGPAETANGLNGLTDEQILRMRAELTQNMVQPASLSDHNNTSNGNNPNGNNGGNGNGTGQPGANGQNQQGGNGSVSTKLNTGRQVSTALNPGTAQDNALSNAVPAPGAIRVGMLPSPTDQSTTYAALRREFDRYRSTHPMSDEQAAKEFQARLRARRQLSGLAGTPGGEQTPYQLTPGGTPHTGQTTGQTPAPQPPRNPEEQMPAQLPPPPGPGEKPVRIQSLSEGVHAQGLKELLAQAEDLMKKGKFAEAIRKYDAAIEVAPNNGLNLVGRANAELGAALYTRAASDLHDAFNNDPAVLMGQYDLTAFIGDERLQYVIGDLKQTASDSPKNATPVFLLAYVSYNTGNTDKAASYLDTAEQRAGGAEPFYSKLKEYWTAQRSAPATQPADLNK